MKFLVFLKEESRRREEKENYRFVIYVAI